MNIKRCAVCVAACVTIPILFLASALGRDAGLQAPLSVWFVPASDAPDTADLFTEPGRWTRARGLVDGVGFSPQQLTQTALPGHDLLLPNLTKASAFQRLKAWGKGAMIEVPAIKGWGCSGNATLNYTLKLMHPIYAAGGTVNFLDMDEPLNAALTPVAEKGCSLDMETAAGEVAAYAQALTSAPEVVASGIVPQIMDIEAYPAVGVQQAEAWIQALQRHGFKPAGLNFDVNIHYVDVTPAAKAHLAGDLQELKRYLRQHGIPFGIIIWSGYDPVKTDKEYFDHSMDWVRTVHAAIGRPDRVIFESWVKRCSLTANCIGPQFGCQMSDPAYCGLDSVPDNLPEGGPGVFSHTRLIREAYMLLTN